MAGAAVASNFSRSEEVPVVRVLHLNIYGRNEKNCEERYREIAKRVREASPPYDVVVFNEHWRIPSASRWICDADVLTKALREDPRYRDSKDLHRSVLHQPAYLDWNHFDGDLSIFTRHKIIDAYQAPFVQNFKPETVGVLGARIELKPGLNFDVWTTHPYSAGEGCDEECRLEQITDLSGALGVLGYDAPTLVTGDFNVGGPITKLQLDWAKEDPKRFPIAGNPGYANMIETLDGARDLWLEKTWYRNDRRVLDPGYTYDCRENNLVTCSYRERIDYLLAWAHPRVSTSPYRLVPRNIEVVRWKTPSGLHVSDHFGLDATLEMRKK
jgi:endonuclease/exonuclease/phosphatase family metal-dependent hydrolase